MKRRGSWVELRVDGGEGENGNRSFEKVGHVSFKLKQRSLFLGTDVKLVSFNRHAVLRNSFQGESLSVLVFLNPI